MSAAAHRGVAYGWCRRIHRRLCLPLPRFGRSPGPLGAPHSRHRQLRRVGVGLVAAHPAATVVSFLVGRCSGETGCAPLVFGGVGSAVGAPVSSRHLPIRRGVWTRVRPSTANAHSERGAVGVYRCDRKALTTGYIGASRLRVELFNGRRRGQSLLSAVGLSRRRICWRGGITQGGCASHLNAARPYRHIWALRMPEHIEARMSRCWRVGGHVAALGQRLCRPRPPEGVA
jgi:hypothetical protein